MKSTPVSNAKFPLVSSKSKLEPKTWELGDTCVTVSLGCFLLIWHFTNVSDAINNEDKLYLLYLYINKQ